MAARILIIDDHQIMREGLRLLLRDQADFEIVGSAFDCEAGWQAVTDLSPDLIVMDLDVPGEGGLALTERVRAKFPKIKVLVLTAHNEAKQITAALRAGADGYVIKTGGGAELLHAMRTVLAGRNYLCPEASTVVVNELHHGTEPHKGPSTLLSPREIEVLKYIADGFSTKEIAFAMELSGKTIETHRLNLMTKLGVDSVAKLTKYALREGLSSL